MRAQQYSRTRGWGCAVLVSIALWALAVAGALWWLHG